MKKKIFELLSPSKTNQGLSYWIDVFLIILISLNVIVVILESVAAINERFNDFFIVFEVFSVSIFTIEYLLRLWVVNYLEAYQKPFWGNLKFALSPLAIIDLLSFLPFYFPFTGLDLRFLRLMRVMRVFRLFKIVRYANATSLISNLFREKRIELFISLIITLFLLLLSSCLMYFIENKAQPENFSSIPETMWWGICTLTTVGYGDMYPITAMGKVLAGIISILGIGLFALPTGILASGFSEQLEKIKNKNKECCPTCGKPLHEKRID